MDPIIKRLFQVAAFNIKHKHYNHVCEKRNKYLQLVAGVNLDSLLKRYVRRESEALFKQRVQLTHHVVTAVSKNLLDIFYKVPRSNSARRLLTYKGDSDIDEKTQQLESLIDKFWGDLSWDDYMSTRWVELNSVDPNAFVIFEWDPFDYEIELLQPRPFEATSEEAVDFQYKNNVLQYLIVKNKHKFRKHQSTVNNKDTLTKPSEGLVDGVKYSLYALNQSFQLLQVDEGQVPIRTTLNQGEVVQSVYEGEPINYVKLGDKCFQFIAYTPHDCNQVPAFRVGYLRDLATNGETYVNPIHAAQPYIEKTIKTNSELDLVATLLAFPQQVKYGLKCEDSSCYKGYYENGSTCNTCNGSGIKGTAPSAQDAVLLPMPDSKDEMIPLKEIITYISPNTDIVKWQEDYIEKLTQKAKRVMFNSDIFDRKNVAETATGKNLDMQNVYDTLYPFAVRFGKLWVFGVKTIAKLVDREANLVAGFTFGKDFKLKTLDNLILDLSIASNIGNPSLIRHINEDIAQIIFSEKPLELQRYKLKELYSPFTGKSEKEIMLLLASPYVSIREKVLHSNFGRIFDELELEHASFDFYKFPRTKQREEIYKKVDEIIAQIDAESTSVEPNLE